MPVNSFDLGPFTLLTPLARGGMASVWLGRLGASAQPVAIKLLMGPTARDPAFRTAFRNEVRVVAALDHPHIIRLLEAGEIDSSRLQGEEGFYGPETPYLVMEFMAGGSLPLQSQGLPWETLREILLQLLDALGHAHARDIFHLDLKPANVLCQHPHSWQVKLSDFGISFMLGEAHRAGGNNLISPGRTFGTPAYMAPEQFAGCPRDYGPWTDLYALGALGWRLATGFPPFGDRRWEELLWAHHTEAPPPFVPTYPMPRGLEVWLLHLLKKRPEHRFACAADARLALLELQDTPPSMSPGVTPIPPNPSPHEDVTVAGVTTPLPPQVLIPPIPPVPDPVLFSRPTPHKDWRTEGHSGDTTLTLPGPALSLFGLRAHRLIGRESARDLLWQALLNVHHTGRAHAVVLKGPAGVGKSRLARWLVETVQEKGVAQVLKVRCSWRSGELDPLARLVVEHLHLQGLSRQESQQRLERELHLLDLVDPQVLESLLELVCPPSTLPSPHNVSFQPGPNGVRLGLERHMVLRRWIEQQARNRPVLVWFDDVQWGLDALELATYVLDTQILSPSPILFVFTVQDEALQERVSAARRLSSLLLRPDAREVPVAPLAMTEQIHLVQGLLALENDPAQEVAQHSRGNPLYAVQLLGDWIERDLLEGGPEGFRPRKVAGELFPRDLHHVWINRVMRVTGGQDSVGTRALQVAAALGEEVVDEEWRTTCHRLGLAVADDLVEQLLQQGLVETSLPREGASLTPLTWSFVHGLLRSSLERQARELGRWEEINRACAEILLHLPPSSGWRNSERRALHLLAAGEDEAALHPLAEAAQSRPYWSWHEAERLLLLRDQALERLGISQGDLPRIANTLDLAYTYQGSYRLTEVERLATLALEFLEHQPDPHLYARARFIQGFCARSQRQFDRAVAIYTELEQFHHTQGNHRDLALCRLWRGQSLYVLGSTQKSSEDLRHARDWFTQQGDKTALGNCLTVLAYIHKDLRQLDEAEALYREALSLPEETSGPVGLHHILTGLAAVLVLRNNFAAALDYSLQAVGVAERHGITVNVASAVSSVGFVKRAMGDLEEAAICFERGIRLFEVENYPMADVARLNLATIYLHRGEYSLVRELHHRSHQGLSFKGDLYHQQVFQIQMLLCAAAEKDWPTWDHLWHQLEPLNHTGRLFDSYDVWPLHRAAELAQAAGEHRRAREVYRRVLPFWERLGEFDRMALIQHKLQQI